MSIISNIKKSYAAVHENKKKENRFYLLIVSLVLIIDYLLFCFHVEKNPFAVIPPMPVLDSRQDVEIYLPDTNENIILKEERKLIINDDSTLFVKTLVHEITAGSKFENTRFAVPRSCEVRKVWIHDNVCVIDIRIDYLKSDITIIPGSEKNFREAVTKTVQANIPGIEKVYLVENGVVNRDFWEIAQK